MEQNIITPEKFDFARYMLETEPKAKVLNAEAWRGQLVDEVRNGRQIKGAMLPWGKTQDNIRFRGGEVTLWQGINGHGKSQLLGMACLGFARQDERVCIASFEMKPVSTLKRCLRQVAMNDQPTELMVNRMMDWMKTRFWLYDQQGTVTPQMIFAVIRYCADQLKIKHIVIDSLMKCVRGEADYDGQKDFVDHLCTLARDLDVHIHLVHHVRKGENEETPPGKFDAKGSGAISDQVDQVLTVWRNKKKEKQIGICRGTGKAIDPEVANAPDALMICDKNRHGEWEGRVALWYHGPSLQYTETSNCEPIDLMGML